jgi:hypothetical protein
VDTNLPTSRIIAAALPLGVAVFWAVAWVLTEGGSRGWSPDAMSGKLALAVWGAAAFACFTAALLFVRRAVEGPGPAEASSLVVAWALLEGPALLAGVLFLLLGDLRLLAAAGVVYVVGLVLTFPRAAWFEAKRSG